MLLNIILISTFLIFSCSRPSLPLEDVELYHDVNEGELSVKRILRNDSGYVRMTYPFNGKDNKYFVLDFNIATKTPLNLLKVSLNGIEVPHEQLYSYFEQPLELKGQEYILDFDDSIDLSGFYIYLNSDLGEHLKLMEIAKNEGLKLEVECVERNSGVNRKLSFNLNVNDAQQLFDFIDLIDKSKTR
ncbi:hypothetical protein [Borrelia coriaceae]|nr:hypothetical protein [Borrelia coriaceae]